jgi:CheY-like chemotaxis protein
LLFVDDEEDFLTTRAELLANAGYTVVCAQSPAEAKAILARQRIDLAIVDYKFPGGETGLELAKEIDPRIPVVILTAHFEAEMVRDALAADEDHHHIAETCLVKSLEFEKFVAELEKYLATVRASAHAVQARTARALLVGIDAYEQAKCLQFCAGDARAVGDVLDVSYQRNVLTTAGTSTNGLTRNQILIQLGEFTKPQPDTDLLLFYFSGHGGVEGGQSYLLASDSDWKSLEITAIPVKQVLDSMRKSRARSKIMLLDACHSGVDGTKTASQDRAFVEAISKYSKGVVVMASCSMQQEARESAQLQQGIFTYFLLQGLRGAADEYTRATVTVSSLHHFVARNVLNYTHTAGSAYMTPTLAGAMEGDIVVNYSHFIGSSVL